MTAARPDDTFAAVPDPGRARTLDELIEGLRSLKVWAGDPSYEWITSEINDAWTAAGRPARELTKRPTVADCFKSGRRRLNTELVIAIVRALHPDVGYMAQWRQALRVVGGEIRAAAQVRVQDRLPPDLAGFTGRSTELHRLRQALRHGDVDGGAVVISTIAGMAGVGKTQLAIRAGHLLAQEKLVDRVLFVNLRGFHPDPAQPPADPDAVLDGFLRLLGVPGQQIPHDLPARVAAYRGRLAGTRTLVVLDNAADAEQVRPLLPETAGCVTLVTSRRDLTALGAAKHLALDVFTPDEAGHFLTRAAPQVPLGRDRHAAARIARRCGHLPLALGLLAGHIRATSGWTLSDHADRLDERHHQRRLDTGVELALDLSYQHLPAEQRRLLRLAALHPGEDLDAHAAAALAHTDPATARAQLRDLRRDHLLQEDAAGRYTFHDLVRGYATSRASDEDPPLERRAALTRLFDYYLATSAAAVDNLATAEARCLPQIPAAGAPTRVLTDPQFAHAWLDAERPVLVAVAAHTAAHGWPTHTTRLAAILFSYLRSGHQTEALAVHGHACNAAHHTDDPTEEAHALTRLAFTDMQLGRYTSAADHLQQALALCQQADDLAGQAHALTILGAVEQRLGDYRSAAERAERALALYLQAGDRTGEARALLVLGLVEERLGRYQLVTGHYERALNLFQQAAYRPGEADTLVSLGDAEVRLGRPGLAAKHLRQALALYRQAGNRTGEAWALAGLGTLHTHLGQPVQATEHHDRALATFRETGERDGEAWALNGLGEAAHTAGRPADALTHHTAAYTIAVNIGARDQQARAHTGLGHAYHALKHPATARRHFEHALTIYTDLDVPEADRIRPHLAALDDNKPGTARTEHALIHASTTSTPEQRPDSTNLQH